MLKLDINPSLVEKIGGTGRAFAHLGGAMKQLGQDKLKQARLDLEDKHKKAQTKALKKQNALLALDIEQKNDAIIDAEDKKDKAQYERSAKISAFRKMYPAEKYGEWSDDEILAVGDKIEAMHTDKSDWKSKGGVVKAEDGFFYAPLVNSKGEVRMQNTGKKFAQYQQPKSGMESNPNMVRIDAQTYRKLAHTGKVVTDEKKGGWFIDKDELQNFKQDVKEVDKTLKLEL
jgi:hypothetical protein